jgi:hypothetical protein
MSHLPLDAQNFGQKNMESAKQDSHSLLTPEAVSKWDSCDWSTFEDALHAAWPLEVIPETILDSIGKLLKKMKV